MPLAKRVQPLLFIVTLIFVAGGCQSDIQEVVVTRPVEVTRIVTETVTTPNETVEVTRMVTQSVIVTREVSVTSETKAPVTLHLTSPTDWIEMDPQITGSLREIDMLENLYVSLTNYNVQTAEIVPEAATNWEISDDGLLYTFYLRSDIPWVYHNPATGLTEQVLDEEGNPRFVTAHDFEFAIKRACMPALGSYYSGIIAPFIQGCETVLDHEDEDNIPEELVAAIGVRALADDVLEIELPFPASYFLTMTPMWTMAATPAWTIAEHGANWTEAGNVVTSGRYVLHEWVHGIRHQLWRNPLLPADMQGSGNVEQIIINVVPDDQTRYALWLTGAADVSPIPDLEIENHLIEFADEVDQVSTLGVDFFSFRTDRPPFDNVNLRRAFAAAVDRQTYITEVRAGQGLPMRHFAPPGIFGAPPIDEVGIGFNPDYARAALAEAGYPECEGLPPIDIMGTTRDASLNLLAYAQVNWAEVLGCDADLLRLQQLPRNDMWDLVSNPDPTGVPHIWADGWGPDYPDENNWVGDVLWCGIDNWDQRPCSAIDDLIVAAREEPDPARRIELYREIEEGFFGEEGLFPIIPYQLRISFIARHSWLSWTPALFGGDQMYNWAVDVEAKAAFAP